ncbi:MAG: glucose 1-dehydrogenase [Pseudomonadota bacterium]
MALLDKFRMDGQVALVTGAGKGIGAGIAEALAEQGAAVVLSARTAGDLETVAGRIRDAGGKALVVPADVLELDKLPGLVDAAFDEYGRLDILVNNAGGFPPMPAADTRVDQFEWAMRFNVTTAFELSRISAPRMVETSGSGCILNISSVAGQYPTPWFSAYGTAKGALSILTREMAQEYAPKVRVNAIGVGSTKTDALNTVLNDEIEQTMVDLTPMARLGEVEDIALGALYLCSPAASYVTGEVLGINGGMVRLNMEMPRAFGGMG